MSANVKLSGEGDIKYVIKTRVRRDCCNCGEPATKRITYLLDNCRRNPASSAYGRDDCTYCSDGEQYACNDCEREVERDTPVGMSWCGTFTADGRFSHMVLYWVEREVTPENLRDFIKEAEKGEPR